MVAGVNLVRILLIIVLAALTVAALMGVATLITSTSPNEEILLSMLSVGLCGLTALGCGIVLERKIWRAGMIIGLALSGLTLAVYLAEIWFDFVDNFFSYRWDDEVIMTLTIWTLALPVAGLQALTRYDNALTWARWATITAIWVTSAMLSISILGQMDEELWWRWTAAAMILTVLGIIGNPVLYRIAGARRQLPPETVRLELLLTCPRCLLAQTLPAGESRCRQCRLRFNIEIEEPRCPQCRYLLYNLTSPRCPECGHVLAPEDIVAPVAATPLTPPPA